MNRDRTVGSRATGIPRPSCEPANTHPSANPKAAQSPNGFRKDQPARDDRRQERIASRAPDTGPGNDRTRARDALEAKCLEYVSTRDPQLRDQIVEQHQWLVVVCARQMQRRNESMEDLVQIANIGLIQALDRFDPQFAVSFRTFASATILGVLRRHYRSTWRLRVPRRVQELHLQVSRAIEDLTTTLQRSPSVAELAAHVAATEEDVLEALDAGANYWPLSLSRGSDGDPGRVPEVVAHERHIEHAEQRLEIQALLNTLPERARTVLYLSYFEDRTQAEIAERLGLSQVHISRIMRAALSQLRAAS